jgi:hypothetical protein
MDGPQNRIAVIERGSKLAMWVILVAKGIWLVLAASFVGSRWQLLALVLVWLLFIMIMLAFNRQKPVISLGLIWLCVLISIGVTYFGGPEPGPLSDKLLNQLRVHMADIAFLFAAHLRYWAQEKAVSGSLATQTDDR